MLIRLLTYSLRFEAVSMQFQFSTSRYQFARLSGLFSVFAVIVMLAGGWSVSRAQESPFDLGNLGLGQSGQPVTLSAFFKTGPDKTSGILTVKAQIEDHWHVYSLTQKPPTKPTVLTVNAGSGYTVTGPFTANSDPILKPTREGMLEEHEYGVEWSAPVSFDPGVDFNSLKIPVRVDGQTCVSNEDGSVGECRSIGVDLTASFRGELAVARADVKFKPQTGHALWSGTVKPGTARPGDTIVVDLTATPYDGYHIYALDGGQKLAMGSPSHIVFSKSNGWEHSKATVAGASHTPADDPAGLPYFSESVTWSFEVTIPRDWTAGDTSLGGSIGFQTCTDAMCDKQATVDFSVPVSISMGDAPSAEPAIVSFTDSSLAYTKVVELSAKIAVSGQASAGQWSSYSLPLVFSLAFLAGFILNFMPCVLPVIGLKIMSFVQQAGENPGRVIWLNTVFSFGIISIFLLLATLAVFFGLGWGELYKNTTFTVIMLSVVFVFGLSFFGIWEIPLPGFVGSAGSGAANKEGFTGTFLKGVLTTLLATPCSGPLIIPAVVWAIAQPWWLTYMAFLAMGLGMAAPYMVIGFFPALVKMLPRPGMWMETFKKLMGFVLMGTVVFFLSGVNNKYQVSTLSLLVFLGMACWWIGNTSLAAELGEKLKAWGYGTVIVGLGIAFSFFVLLPQHELDWQPYSKFQFDKLLAEGNTVFVDFTADW